MISFCKSAFWIVAGERAGAENWADLVVERSRKSQISSVEQRALNLVEMPSSTVWAYGTTSAGTVPFGLTARAGDGVSQPEVARERERVAGKLSTHSSSTPD